MKLTLSELVLLICRSFIVGPAIVFGLLVFGETSHVLDLDQWYNSLADNGEERQLNYRKFFQNFASNPLLNVINFFMKFNNSNSRLIYSTDFGSACPNCGKPKNNCICRQIKKKAVPETSGALHVSYEIAGRKGKGVTLITGLPLSEERLQELSKKLKQQLGTGGTIKDFAIELQGDHREKVLQALRKLGYYDKVNRQ